MAKTLENTYLDDGWKKIAEYDEIPKLYKKAENGSYFLYSISNEDSLTIETKIEEKPILGFDLILDNEKILLNILFL
ncbi:MAG: hypothetical protein AABW90_02845 [Nanoarchaeota archaeon]